MSRQAIFVERFSLLPEAVNATVSSRANARKA